MITERVAIITGASQGLGRALAEHLSREGWSVVAVARGEALLSEVVRGIVREGGRAIAVAADIADPEAATRIAGRAQAMGQVELLVHAASSLGPVPLRPLLDISSGEFEDVVQTNLLGPFRLTRAVAGAMAIHHTGTVLFVSSDAAVEAYPGWGIYGCTKAAADHLARTFAAELGDRGVRVHSVDPGEMDTMMHAAALPDADRTALAEPWVVARAIVKRLDESIPSVRFAAGAS